MRKRGIGRIACFSLALLAILSWHGWSGAQPNDLQLPAQVEEQINTIARQSTTSVHQLLNRHGFPPPNMKFEEWRGAWSAARSLNLAYRSAEKAAQGSGTELLNRIQWDYFALNPAMVTPGGQQPRGQRSFRFADLTATDLQPPLPEPVEKIVRVISRHADVKLRVFLGRCCGVADTLLEKIMRESPSAVDAIRSVLIEGQVPPELRTRLALLLESVLVTNPAIAFDGNLANLRRDLLALDNPTPDRVTAISQSDPDGAKRYGRQAASLDAALDRQLKSVMKTAQVATASDMALGQHIVDAFSPDPSPRPMASSMPSMPSASNGVIPSAPQDGSRLATAADRAFDLQTYGPSALAAHPRDTRPAPTGNAFRRVIAHSGGRGGVVFGAEVDGSMITALPLSVGWIPLDTQSSIAETKGSFRIRLADDRVLYTPPITAGVALATVRIALTGRADLTHRHIEQAEIGLAGLRGFFDIPRVTTRGVTRALALSGRRCSEFVVHPAIVDTPVGHAAIALDGLLFSAYQPVLERVLSAIDLQGRTDFNRFQSVRANTYKFVERALTLSLDEDRGVVRALATDPKGLATIDAPRIIWTRFASDIAIEDNPEEAQAAMLTLRAASTEYALLDSFAEQLAILRWAASKGAAWLGGVDDGARSLVATALCRHDAYFELAPSRYALALEVVDSVATESGKLLGSTRISNSLRQYNDQVTADRRRIVELASLASLFNDKLQEQAKRPTGGPERALVKIIQAIPLVLMKPGQASNTIETIIDEALTEKPSVTAEARVSGTIAQQRQEIWDRDPSKLSLIDAWNGFLANLSSSAKATVSQAYPEAIPIAFIRWHTFQTTFAAACPSGMCAN